LAEYFAVFRLWFFGFGQGIGRIVEGRFLGFVVDFGSGGHGGGAVIFLAKLLIG
jgi:hypothetical protein